MNDVCHFESIFIFFEIFFQPGFQDINSAVSFALWQPMQISLTQILSAQMGVGVGVTLIQIQQVVNFQAVATRRKIERLARQLKRQGRQAENSDGTKVDFEVKYNTFKAAEVNFLESFG